MAPRHLGWSDHRSHRDRNAFGSRPGHVVAEAVKSAADDGKFALRGLTFDDVLLLKNTIVPGDVDTASHVTRNIAVRLPLVSSAMDTVTEAQWPSRWRGKVGWVCFSEPADRGASQSSRSRQAFRSGNGRNPSRAGPTTRADVDTLCAKPNFRSARRGRLRNSPRIVTNRDMRFEEDMSITARGSRMPLVTASVG